MHYMHALLAWLLSSTWLSLGLAASDTTAQEPGGPAPAPNLAVKVSTAFPQSEIFGVKLVNGRATQAVLSFTNDEPGPVTVAFIGGSLWGLDPQNKGERSVIVRNITSTRFNVQIPAGGENSISYNFATELHPQDLRLNLVAVMSSEAGGVYSLSAYNETVSVVEPETGIFDPQLLFLYLLLAALFGGSCYFIYSTWIVALFPQKPRSKPGDRGKRAGGSKKAESNEHDGVLGGQGAAVATGAKPYDETWIPELHINRPEAKRVKSGAGKSKGRGKGE